MDKSTIYVVTEVYYKHGEGFSKIFTDEGSLESYLYEKLHEYNYVVEIIEDLQELIEISIEKGREQIHTQRGTGIIEIKSLCVTGKDIKFGAQKCYD